MERVKNLKETKRYLPFDRKQNWDQLIHQHQVLQQLETLFFFFGLFFSVDIFYMLNNAEE